MINIGDLLSDYTKIKNPLIEKRSITEALNNKFNLKLNEGQFFLRKNTVVFKVNSVQKSFIYMRKNEMVIFLNEIAPERYITNIQF